MSANNEILELANSLLDLGRRLAGQMPAGQGDASFSPLGATLTKAGEVCVEYVPPTRCVGEDGVRSSGTCASNSSRRVRLEARQSQRRSPRTS